VPGGVSTSRTSRSPQLTLSTNCLMIEFFFGPRHMTCVVAHVEDAGWSRRQGARSAYRFFGICEQKSDGHDQQPRANRALDGQPTSGALEHLSPLQPRHHGNAAGRSSQQLTRENKKKRLEGRTRLGPQRSTSSSPTFKPLFARLNASCTATVLLPTPPLPDSTRTQCLKGMMM
jgi:hypothetical protein